MRKVFLPPFPDIPANIQKMFSEIADASQSGDITDIGGAFAVTGAFVETRTLNVGTSTLTQTQNFLATLIADLKRGGATRTT